MVLPSIRRNCVSTEFPPLYSTPPPTLCCELFALTMLVDSTFRDPNWACTPPPLPAEVLPVILTLCSVSNPTFVVGGPALEPSYQMAPPSRKVPSLVGDTPF